MAGGSGSTRVRRRGLLFGALSVFTAPAAHASGALEVWVDLSVPALASQSHRDRGEREARRARIVAQQDDVMAALRSLGGVERGRLQQLRNALAVTLPREQIDAARQIPGVLQVRPVRHVERVPPQPRE